MEIPVNKEIISHVEVAKEGKLYRLSYYIPKEDYEMLIKELSNNVCGVCPIRRSRNREV